MGQGILEADHFTHVITSVVLLSIGLSLLIANLLGIPQSTSQASVLSIVGAATYLGGLNTRKLFLEIIPTWFILPVIAFLLMYGITKFICPLLQWSLRRLDFRHLSGHPVIRWLVLISSGYVAFSIGANNVANAAGPIASMTINELGLIAESHSLLLVTILSVLVVAPCFGIGSSLFGYKVTRKTGKDIVSVGPMNACAIAFITASLLLSASLIRGIPTSLVQLNTSAFIAVSISREGWRNTFANPKVRSFFVVWALAPLFAFGLTIALLALCERLGWIA